MYKICVFGGTTEGRHLVEFLTNYPISVTACVATEYGEDLLEQAENLKISACRLPKDEIKSMFQETKYDLVVDATHPYAISITESISSACYSTGTEYLRLIRSSSDVPDEAVYVSSSLEAVEYLNTTTGNILLTTGTKDLMLYTKIKDYSSRVYARILPMEDSLKACRQAGIKPAHIIAMQGPFSKEMNVAILRDISAQFMVTKDGGTPGGFQEKILATRELGAKIIIIGRPPLQNGLSLSQVIDTLCARFHLAPKTEVSIVGIGPGGRDSLTVEAYRTIKNADCLIGAKRVVEAVTYSGQMVFHAVTHEAITEFIKNHSEYRRITIVMSGDVGFFSGTKKLLAHLIDSKVQILPGLNSMMYLCAKLQTSYEDIIPVSLHGRKHDIVREVSSNSRVFVLVGGENGIKNLCITLATAGLGDVKISVGERLSYKDEKITIGKAQELSSNTYDSLSVALIENDNIDDIVTHGLPDEMFLRGSSSVIPMTKSEVRSLCLSKLQLTSNALCWDIGAGTGSVSIEMAVQAVKGQVYAIERKNEAVELLYANRNKFHLSDKLSIVHGLAPDSCKKLPIPTHVFIGGSGGNMREIISLILSKNSKARIVATAITLESVAELTYCMKEFSFDIQEVVSLSVARSQKAREYHLMTGQNPIYIFTMQNTGGSL